jgi:hypothetical protein
MREGCDQGGAVSSLHFGAAPIGLMLKCQSAEPQRTRLLRSDQVVEGDCTPASSEQTSQYCRRQRASAHDGERSHPYPAADSEQQDQRRACTKQRLRATGHRTGTRWHRAGLSFVGRCGFSACHATMSACEVRTAHNFVPRSGQEVRSPALRSLALTPSCILAPGGTSR